MEDIASGMAAPSYGTDHTRAAETPIERVKTANLYLRCGIIPNPSTRREDASNVKKATEK
jgi:hypothetical protein